jgi:hypothetical protein
MDRPCLIFHEVPFKELLKVMSSFHLLEKDLIPWWERWTRVHKGALISSVKDAKHVQIVCHKGFTIDGVIPKFSEDFEDAE